MIQLLEHPKPGSISGTGPSDEEQGRAVEVSVDHADEGIRMSHAAADGTYTHPAGQASVGVCHVRSRLFISGVHHPYAGLAARQIERIQAVSAQGGYVLHPSIS